MNEKSNISQNFDIKITQKFLDRLLNCYYKSASISFLTIIIVVEKLLFRSISRTFVLILIKSLKLINGAKSNKTQQDPNKVKRCMLKKMSNKVVCRLLILQACSSADTLFLIKMKIHSHFTQISPGGLSMSRCWREVKDIFQFSTSCPYAKSELICLTRISS